MKVPSVQGCLSGNTKCFLNLHLCRTASSSSCLTTFLSSLERSVGWGDGEGVSGPEQGRSWGLCDNCACVCGLFSTWEPEKQTDGRIKGIRGWDWERLIKAHATISLMNSLTPSAEVNSSFPNPLLLLPASVSRHVTAPVYQCPGSHRLHLARVKSGNLWLAALWHGL